jgi:hypothetical protein
MSKDNELPDLSQKGINVEAVAAKALEDEQVLQALLDGISPVSKKNAIRSNSYEALMCLAGDHPTVLFPHWGYFVELLDSDNKFSAYCAVHLVAALAQADVEGRFEIIFDAFYNLLDDESVMIAGHVAGLSGKIAGAKPDLQLRITEKLLSINATHFEQGHKDMLKSYIIESFDVYFEEANDQETIIEFVRQQLDCSSPKTRKVAKRFLKKWEREA